MSAAKPWRPPTCKARTPGKNGKAYGWIVVRCVMGQMQYRVPTMNGGHMWDDVEDDARLFFTEAFAVKQARLCGGSAVPCYPGTAPAAGVAL